MNCEDRAALFGLVSELRRARGDEKVIIEAPGMGGGSYSVSVNGFGRIIEKALYQENPCNPTPEALDSPSSTEERGF